MMLKVATGTVAVSNFNSIPVLIGLDKKINHSHVCALTVELKLGLCID